MPNLLWRKAIRDLWLNKPRTVLTVLVIAIGVFAMSGVLSAYAILSREIKVNYLSTTPASATLEVSGLTDDLVRQVRARPGIGLAEARESVAVRIQVGPNNWQRLILYVVQDFERMQLATVAPVQGQWPPGDGEMLVERVSLQVAQAQVGQEVTIKMANGAEAPLRIAGLVHDPSQAPGWMDNAMYGYITARTLARLDPSARLGELKIVVARDSYNEPQVRATALDLADWLRAQGYPVARVLVPPPGSHPHQSQMNALLFLLSVFGFLTLVLGGVLTANMVSAMLAQQTRQIGMLKAVGARGWQVMAMYAGVVLGFSLAALIVGLPLGVLAGQAGATAIAQILNFEITSYAVPAWVYALQALTSLVVPLGLASIPIYQGGQATVRQALADYGVSQEALQSDRLGEFLVSIRGLSRLLLLSLRNTFRRRTRLALTLAVLGVGGALLMSALNLTDSWQASLAAANEARRYDVDVRLQDLADVDRLQPKLAAIPGVTRVEVWGYSPAALSRPGQAAIERTYPDGAHGSFSVLAPPPDTALVRFTLQQGRWLEPGDTDAVVLNHSALAKDPALKLGDRIALNIDGRTSEWRLVGVVREFVSPATAYVPLAAFQQATRQPGRALTFRLVTERHDAAAQKVVAGLVERELAAAGLGAVYVMPATTYATISNDHVVVLTITLFIVAALMVVVGVLGLTSTMSLNVLERTHEFGVLQSIGARPRVVRRTVMVEGLVIAGLSWLLGAALSLPMTGVIGMIVGRVGFGAPLLFAVSVPGLLGWMVLLGVLAALGSYYPARRAARMTVREILAYE